MNVVKNFENLRYVTDPKNPPNDLKPSFNRCARHTTTDPFV